MKKHYNDPIYDAAFDRCASILAALMVKYGPKVLLKQAVEKILGKGCVDFNDPENPRAQNERLTAYQQRYSEITTINREVKDKTA